MMRKYGNVAGCSLALVILGLACLLCGCGDSREATELIGRPAESVEETQTDSESATQETQPIYVYVCGAVNSPGVVTLTSESRIEAALKAAGGFTQEADREYVNLAAWVEDGARIYFPTEEETKALTAEIAVGIQSGQNASGTATVDGEKSKMVNINTADADALCKLPGIGESRAQDIIAYREKNGSFETGEDIMKVSGIKTAVYEKIKDKITVQ